MVEIVAVAEFICHIGVIYHFMGRKHILAEILGHIDDLLKMLLADFGDYLLRVVVIGLAFLLCVECGERDDCLEGYGRVSLECQHLKRTSVTSVGDM